MADPLYPAYSPAERAADNVVHVLGIAFAAGASVVLGHRAAAGVASGFATALLVYGFGLNAMLWCSALYNFARAGPRKRLLRRLDHAAIFVMIAGTYTPFTLVGLHGPWRVAALGFMWGVASAGAALKLFVPGRLERLSVAIYLLLGWSGLLVLNAWLTWVPVPSLVLLAVGGVLYSSGVFFHLRRAMPYHNAVWHAFVLAAAVAHFGSVMTLAIAINKPRW